MAIATRRRMGWSAVESELAKVDGLIASSLVRSRLGGKPPDFAEKLERMSIDIVRVRDESIGPDERLAVFDAAFRQLEALAETDPTAAVRALTADALRMLGAVRASLVGVLAELKVPEPLVDSFLRASVEEPGVHRVATSPLRVSSRERVRYRDRSQLRLGLRGTPRTPSRAGLVALTRDTMEDISALGSLRRLSDDEPARRAKSFEARLLANLDYLAALGRGRESVDLVSELSSYLNEAVFADPGRVFAVAMTHACIEGPTPLPGLIRLIMSANERTERALVDALALGSNPRIDHLLTELLHEDGANVLAIALAAQARRGRAPHSVLSLLEHPSERVAELAAKASAYVEDPSSIAPALADHLNDRPKVAAACLTTLATLGAQIALRESRFIAERVATGEITDLRGDAAVAILSLTARKEDGSLIARAAPRTRLGIAWLGWLGDPTYFEVIVAGVDAALAKSARSMDDFLVSPAFSAVERLVSKEALDALTAEPTQTREMLAKLPTARIRRGAAWSPNAVTQELCDENTLQSNRRLLVLEASITQKRPLRFDPDGWQGKERRKLTPSP